MVRKDLKIICFCFCEQDSKGTRFSYAQIAQKEAAAAAAALAAGAAVSSPAGSEGSPATAVTAASPTPEPAAATTAPNKKIVKEQAVKSFQGKTRASITYLFG